MEALPLAALFGASLAGSPHCAGMCGGFVAFYAAKADRPFLSHLGYNAGRLLTYCLLGAAAGLLGTSLDSAAGLAGIQRMSGLVMGALLILFGASELLGSKMPLLPRRVLTAMGRISTALSRTVFNLRVAWPVRSFLLGLVSGFLPCGWLYGFLALAAASASSAGGALTMAVFWLGTLPALASLGVLARTLSLPLRRHLPRITALLLIAAGLFSLSGRLPVRAANPQPHQCHSD